MPNLKPVILTIAVLSSVLPSIPTIQSTDHYRGGGISIKVSAQKPVMATADFKAVEQAKPVETPKPAAVAPKTATPAPVSSGSAMTGCGDNSYANFIYMHESGCRLGAVNPIGACGLGQALPCSKLANVCPNWQNDYACQNSFFTSYANGKGGWGGAYAFWIAHSWW